MIKIENIEVSGFRAALRGMRNPLNSWNKSDSVFNEDDTFLIGEKDLDLAGRLITSGSPDRKFLRMIHVSMDVTAPLYWWKEYDTYKISTVANSCSTMHKLAAKPFELSDFSTDHLNTDAIGVLRNVIDFLNAQREIYVNGIHGQLKDDKAYWWNMIQLLPTSYNQRRTLDLNYETLRAIYYWRKNHKLDEWRELCKALEALPYAKEFIVN